MEKGELDLEPLLDAIIYIANENLKTIEKIERGETVSEVDLLILQHSIFGFSILNNRFRKYLDKI